MATVQTSRVVLQNPKVEALLAVIYTDISAIHKQAARDVLARHQPKLNKPETFAWASSQRARKFASIDVVPVMRPPATIAFIDGGKGAILAEAAEAAVRMWARVAPYRTGVLAGSLEIMLNGRPRSLSELKRFSKTNPFNDDEEVWIFPRAFYASFVESNAYLKDKRGIVFQIARELITRLGTRASIQFAYIQGQGNFALPAIRIGAPGAFRSGTKRSTPGVNARKNLRKFGTKRKPRNK